ncbi:MAG TPA: Gfo/Idh/MocA family oxidoreductase [Gemmata sp.]|nr:Gfo/Idh/MocA family oxidoreductase [Gemmata sp.]
MNDPTTRRTFLKASAASAIASTALLPGAYAGAGNETLRVGLVGCGGRGSGAAREALRADPNTKLVAMCDVFMDRLNESLQGFKTAKSNRDIAPRVDVPEDRRFDGFDGYKKLLNCGVDVVLLATPPGFRPLHLRAAIVAGKHVFCEKPVAVDVPGIH